MNIALIVGSCDKYHFLWDKFSFLLDKYWDKGIDIPKYIITQNVDPKIHNIQSILVETPLYTTGLRKALDTIKNEYVLWLQDDYFLRRKLSFGDFNTYCGLTESWKADRFGIHEDSTLYAKQQVCNNIYKLKQFSLYTISLQASIWKTDFLYSLLDHEESPWEFEVQGSERLNNHKQHNIYYAAQDPPWYLEACRKGEFTNDFYNICNEEGINATTV